MNEEERIRLFLYNSAVVTVEVAARNDHALRGDLSSAQISTDDELRTYVGQFEQDIREKAVEMSKWYMLFYMLENDMRRFIQETLELKDKVNWWESCVPEHVRKDAALNRNREQDFGFAPRSDELLDYTTFGHLGDIIRENWDVFGGLLSSIKAVGRVMATLNTLRGPIAHCGVLAPDEIDRLKLSVKDWFRVLAGPA